MTKTVTFPIIRVEHHYQDTLSGTPYSVWHVYVNGDFYMAFSTKEEVMNAIDVIATVELEGA